MRKAKNGTSNKEAKNKKPANLFNDIESLGPPASKKTRVQGTAKLSSAEGILTQHDNGKSGVLTRAQIKAGVSNQILATNYFHMNPLTHVDNDLTNKSADVEQICSADSNEAICPIVTESCTKKSIDTKPIEKFADPPSVAVSKEIDSDTEDNCSVASELSLFASDCEIDDVTMDFDDQDTEDYPKKYPIFELKKRTETTPPPATDQLDETTMNAEITPPPAADQLDDAMMDDEDGNNGLDRKSYGIPELKKPTEIAPQPSTDQGQLANENLDDKVEEILTKYRTDSPKMLSPVRDLETSLKRLRYNDNCKRQTNEELRDKLVSRSPDDIKKLSKLESKDSEFQPNRKSIATEPAGKGEACNLSELVTFDMTASKGIEFSEELRNSKENLVVNNTTTITTQGKGLRSAFKSSIDFQNLPKLTIRAGNLHSTRIISLAPDDSTLTHLPIIPAVPAALEPVPCSQQMNGLVPVPCSEQMNDVARVPALVHQQPMLPSAPLLPHHQPLIGHAVPQPIDSVDHHANTMEKQRKITEVVNLFGLPCINFLNEKPCKSSPCPYNHDLPSPDAIFSIMNTRPDDMILFIYSEFIVKCRVTFVQYFPMICYLYGTRKMEAILELLVTDCELYERYDYLECVFNALTICGIPDVDALIKIVELCSVTCEASHRVMVKIARETTLKIASEFALRNM